MIARLDARSGESADSPGRVDSRREDPLPARLTLRDALCSERWFRRRSWERAFEPFSFRWMGGILEYAPSDDLFNTKRSKRHFSPFEVLANDWEFADGR